MHSDASRCSDNGSNRDCNSNGHKLKKTSKSWSLVFNNVRWITTRDTLFMNEKSSISMHLFPLAQHFTSQTCVLCKSTPLLNLLEIWFQINVHYLYCPSTTSTSCRPLCFHVFEIQSNSIPCLRGPLLWFLSFYPNSTLHSCHSPQEHHQTGTSTYKQVVKT